MEGIVYILTNEAMPGFLKIGFTQADLKGRIRSLNNTSVPFDFECVYAARVGDCKKVEELIFTVFSDRRPNPRREFFLVDVVQAKAALQLAAIEDVTPSIEEVIPDPVERDAAQRMSRKRRSVTLFDVGLPVGTALTLDRAPEKACIVVGPGEVEFDGARMSPSAAALQALNELGYVWPTANGWAHWTYDGRPIRELAIDFLARGDEAASD